MPGLTKDAWEIRAVQLDLARQMETLETIRAFVDFSAEVGFNALALYLEGRIRTKTFPFPKDGESYSPDEIREIVQYAASRGLDVIPIVSTLGHAELFLRQDALKPLAELREGGKGRFGTTEFCSFCPSVEKTYEFFRGYLAELSEIFPSQYFHIGCDEVWDMGYCSLCRERLQKGERLDDLYLQHVLRVYDIVAEELGRTVIIWDDFLEELPSVLERLPTDIVLCVWQYDSLVEQTKTHFGCRRWDHRLAEYDRLGFAYLVVPWAAQGTRNSETLTVYARNFQPRGGILTLWDGDVLEEQYPVIAFAGKLWRNPDEADGKKIGLEAYAALFGCRDPLFLEAVWTVASPAPMARRFRLRDFLSGPPTPYAFERANQARLFIELIAAYRAKVSRNWVVLEEIGKKLRFEILQGEIQELMEGFYTCWNGGRGSLQKLLLRGRRIAADLKDFAEDRSRKLRSRYPGEPNGTGWTAQELERKLEEELNQFLDAVESGRIEDTALLAVRYALPDFYGWPLVRWSIQYADNPEWTILFEGNPKPREGDYSDCPYFQQKLPVSGTRRVRRARIEVSGYGGIGLLGAEVVQGPLRYSPLQIETFEGKVRDPGRILKNDTRMCWLGESSTAEAFHCPPLAEEVASLEMRFAEEKTRKR